MEGHIHIQYSRSIGPDKWILRRKFLRQSWNLADPVCWRIQVRMRPLNATDGRDIRVKGQNKIAVK